MGAPRKHVAVRLDDETLAQVHALLPQLTTEWRRATLSDALRALIVAELKHLRDDPAELQRVLAPR
jgi:hypothetical protein